MFRILALLLFFLITMPRLAMADYFLWQDTGSGLTISFPDNWKVINNQKPDDILTIVAPSQNENPVCKVKVREDRRYLIYPPKYGKEVQRVAVSQAFWEDYLSEYGEYRISKVHDGAGLGRWFASYALAGYTAKNGAVTENRRGIMFASLYNNKTYIVECSTLEHAYERWRYIFQSIIKSIDFKKTYHELPGGDYKDFKSGIEQYFFSQTGQKGTTAY